MGFLVKNCLLPLQIFVAELAVPLRSCHEVYVAVGQGRNKSEAERACCTAACEKLYQEGLLNKSNSQNPSSSVPVLKPCPTKAVQIQQVSLLCSLQICPLNIGLGCHSMCC